MIHFRDPSLVRALRCLLFAVLICSGDLIAKAEESTIVCPTCSQGNPAKNHFCGNCGTNLDSVVKPETPLAPAEKKKSPLLALFRFKSSVKPPGGGHSSALSDAPVPLGAAVQRPKPLIEIGQNPFLGSGTIAPGFTLPTGAVWQPVFIVYGTARSALQVFDADNRQITEWANRLDLFGNLYLTPTERILVGIRPLDKNSRYSGYRFFPNADTEDDFNLNIRTLFFEGDFGELFPKLDPNDRRSLDYGFAVGRQPLSFQDGIMISDDAIDAVGITRSSLFVLGASAVRATALFGWNEINRNNNTRDNGSAKLFGLFMTADYPKTSIDLDIAYVNDPGSDGFYVGVGATQRFFGHLNTTFRVNTSFALNEESAAVSNGTLLFGQLSTVLPFSKDVVYLNTFWGIENYSSADRGPDAGGPLGQTGILFAAQGLGNYGAPLGNRANSAAGVALGFQKFIGGTDKQLVVEIGGRTNTRTPEFFAESQTNAIAAAARYQMKLDQHSVLIFDAFVAFPEDHDTSFGARAELLIKF